MSKVLKEKIESIEQLAPLIFKITIKSEYVARNARPGQFVNIKCSEGINALLRRPISICRVDRRLETFDIVFQVKGLGTEYLSKKKPGEVIDFIGPLGRPFDISEKYRRVAVVGGGIGVFPLLQLLGESQADRKLAFLGFRSKEYIVLKEQFEAECNKLQISTDDGSFGSKGLITGPLQKQLEDGCIDLIYACGPTPMLKKTVELASQYGVSCQVSLEQRMGCGIGACLVCACKTKYGDDWEYSHVCKDGPVFWAQEVVFDD